MHDLSEMGEKGENIASFLNPNISVVIDLAVFERVRPILPTKNGVWSKKYEDKC